MAAKKRVKGKLSGLKSDGSPNAYWRRFKERLDGYGSIPTNDWKAEEVLGYLLTRYKNHYQMDWTLSYSGAPSKCSEMYSVRRMIAALGTENGTVIKEYLDWVFDSIITPKKVEIKSIGYFFVADFIHKFKTQAKKRRTITRSTQLPPEIENVANGLDVSVVTYGDLAFAKMAVDSSPDDYPQYNILFQQLHANGFDDSVLEKLEG